MKTITKQIGSETYQYNVYKRKKKSGGFREITAPEPRLKSLQREYALAFYEKVKDEFNSAEITGFMPGVSIKDNARSHIDKEWVINLDIKSFFPSTNKQLVEWAMKKAKLDADLETAIEVLTLNDALPQGSPASPILANYIAMYYVDPVIKMIANTYLKNIEYSYSRYADDVTISINEKLDRVYLKEMIIEICKELAATTPFKVAHDKIHLRNKGQKQYVTGIVVNKMFSVDRKEKMKLRAAMHHVKMGKRELDSKLRGKMNFVRDVNPAIFEKLTKGINYVESNKSDIVSSNECCQA